MTRLARIRHLTLAVLLAALLPAASAFAQSAAVSAHPAWSRIQTLESEIAALPAADTAADGEDALVALTRRLRLERELRDALGELIADLGADADDAAVRERIAGQARTMQREVAGLRERIDALREAREQAADDALLGFEYRLRDLHDMLSALLADLVDNAERGARVGRPGDADFNRLDSLLGERAARLAGRLELAIESIADAEQRRRNAPEDQHAALDIELTALTERRERLRHSLSETIDLMNRRGLDTTELSQLMFRATGEISGDLFDRRVLAGLLGAWMDDLRATLAENGPGWLFKLLVFIAIVLGARALSRLTARVVQRAVGAPHLAFSTLLQEFFVKVAANLVLGLGLLVALSQIGFELGPLLAGLGVAGFIIGFALQETLSNFASGLMILIYRPFDVGDVVEAGGVSGVVRHMSLVSTTINTFDNQKLVVPNNKIWGDVIRNVNAEPRRRVDMSFGIGYGDDIARATAVLEAIVGEHELVLDDPAPVVRLHTLGESSVDFLVRPWVLSADYWTVYWDVTRAVKERFDAEGISIPFPQRDVHLYRAGED